MFATQGEYRFMLPFDGFLGRFGVVAFGGFGGVGTKFSDIGSGDLLPGGGGGARFRLLKKHPINFRVDYGHRQSRAHPHDRNPGSLLIAVRSVSDADRRMVFFGSIRPFFVITSLVNWASARSEGAICPTHGGSSASLHRSEWPQV